MSSNPKDVHAEIHSLLSQKNYPCVAAVKSMQSGEYRLGFYEELGSGRSSFELGADLLSFLEEQKASGSLYLSFWAIFSPPAQPMTEAEFEAALWAELSQIASHPQFESPWDPNYSADPADKDFSFSLGGSAFFVVGLHPQSSRLSRRFSRPALVFNLHSQFESLYEMGQYEPMVKANRSLDLKFQGNLNPMVERHADQWDAIQFSGRANSNEWKCPFRHLQKPKGSGALRQFRLSPQTGQGFELKKGEFLKVIDPTGEQVSDLFCFNREDLGERLSSGHSIDYAETTQLTTGDGLYSNRCRLMLTILEDSCGRHDFLIPPCSAEMLRLSGIEPANLPTCRENLRRAFEPIGVSADAISTTFNIFMNVESGEKGALKIKTPRSKAGDFVVFRAEMDLFVGLTACSDEATNNGICKPIQFEIY